jgi:hypothetical protein
MHLFRHFLFVSIHDMPATVCIHKCSSLHKCSHTTPKLCVCISVSVSVSVCGCACGGHNLIQASASKCAERNSIAGLLFAALNQPLFVCLSASRHFILRQMLLPAAFDQGLSVRRLRPRAGPAAIWLLRVQQGGSADWNGNQHARLHVAGHGQVSVMSLLR